jgi:ectoine hydroxylase-related dioxygenase (phytanoyl-CoA dioxygenase family)
MLEMTPGFLAGRLRGCRGPAGTVLVFESRLWYATGPNRMTSGERPVVLLFFMRSFVRPQANGVPIPT